MVWFYPSLYLVLSVNAGELEDAKGGCRARLPGPGSEGARTRLAAFSVSLLLLHSPPSEEKLLGTPYAPSVGPAVTATPSITCATPARGSGPLSQLRGPSPSPSQDSSPGHPP